MRTVRVPEPRKFHRVVVPFRACLVTVVAALMLGVTAPASTFAAEDGLYIMQCGCMVEWTGDWDGNGIFSEEDTLDTIALSNGSGVILMHEIPAEDGTLEDLVEERSAILDDSRAISDLEETYTDSSQQSIATGRTWENADGDLVYGFQYVQVWEVNFILSIEFVSTEDAFVDEWDTLEDVLLVGSPILGEFDAEEIADLIGGN